MEERTMFSFTAPVNYALPSMPLGMVSADVNNDEKPDVVSMVGLPVSVNTMLGNGDGTFAPPVASPLTVVGGVTLSLTGQGSMTTADFNGDWKLDIGMVTWPGAQMGLIMMGNGDGTFQAPKVFNTGGSATRIDSGDVNGDGKADLAMGNANGTVHVLIGQAVSVSSAAAVSISTSVLKSAVAGVAQSVTVTARDQYGNVATGYRGAIVFSSSDTLATLPAAYTFTAADSGTKTFSIALKTAAGQTFGVTDSVNGLMSTFQKDIFITPAAFSGFSTRAPSNVTAGTAFSLLVSAVDVFGNAITNYTGKTHFSGPGGSGNLLPADYVFTAADAGTHTFSITLSSTGTQTININDTTTTSIKRSTSIVVKTVTTSGGGGTTTGDGTGGGGSGGSGKTVVA